MTNSAFSKRTWNLIIIFLVVAAVGLFFINRSQNIAEEEIQNDISLSPSATPISTVKKTTSPTVKSQEYTQLVKEYEGRRIQFDIGCQAIPNNITYKNGTKIMLDNRSGDARTITVGGIQYQLAGYGYRVITLSSQTLPKTLLISCGAAVNVGQILLQN